MRKIFATVFFLAAFITAHAQNVPSMQEFLGYGPGAAFTPHYKILNYFRALAQSKPSMMKLEKYGETYEGRDLVVAYISSAENLQRLDDIRKNNVALTQGGNVTNGPAIVWLSYNVHGNEPSSSEAAMLTAYTLLSGRDTRVNDWLKNTVVIIDPCLNPDGRDRYVNWYNSMKGKNANVNPQTREHIEPWPGGRTNHYNFDLNRDWAWQTQKETQQRIKLYQQWMPEIHVDFHEQGYNEPYYFAPAAEPFHEVITPWQREMQTLIGKNNAKYFDQNNWLFFTKERFDLFYPSYGDTYPLYNGAIGMTFEQGGHSRGGLGVINAAGDTLTLTDRVMHHFTTGLSTVEITSQQAPRVLQEFKKFYDNSSNAAGSDFKTYILTSNNLNQLKSVAELLDRNQIRYGITTTQNLKGYNYQSGKDEQINAEKYQLAVSAYQPHSVLAKVLLEPKGKLTDSLTYDITAWSVPYAYGVKAYGLKEKRDISNENIFNTTSNFPGKVHGYLKEWKSFDDARFLSALLQKGIKVRFAEKEFTTGNKKYSAGTLIVLKTSNQQINNLDELVKNITDSLNAAVDPIGSGFVDAGADLGSPDVRLIKKPRVALITGEQSFSSAAGEVWHLFDQQLNYPVNLVNANDLSRVSFTDYDVIILPDGSYRFFSDKSTADKLKLFISSGGKLIAMQNAIGQIATADWGIKTKTDKDDNAKDKPNEYADLKKYGDRDRTEAESSIPGAIYKITLDNTHPLAFGYPDFYYTLKQDTDTYSFLKTGWNVGVVKKDDLVSGFVGSEAKQKIKDALVFGVQNLGSGSIIYLVDDPMFRSFWQNGKLLFCNAVFLVNQ